MKNKNVIDEEDDGRTIADMSFFDRKTIKSDKEVDPNKEELKGENLRAFIKGTMKATAIIWFVYVAVFGIVILLMYLYFKSKL